MLITKKEELERFNACHRLWQGIPGIERTRGGRTFLTFYSGGVSEQSGNFAVVIKSDNDLDFSEPIAAAFKDGDFRCFDTTLWIDPLGRLWFIWNVAPGEECYAAICDDPDADTLVWGKEFYVGRGVMLNKPIVLTSGEWLFPISLWNFNIRPWSRLKHIRVGEVARSNVYKTVDNGKTFTLLGGSEIAGRNFDEHSIVELDSGVLMMTVRTDYGTGKSFSYDRGRSWTRGEDAKFGSCVSRIHIRKLRSGRLLRISHDGQGRTNLTAFLSEDDGKTYPYKLLLDARKSVSYPDATESDDGYIYITYDRERGNNMGCIENAYASAREILIAKISEQDIILGEVKDGGSFLSRVASKLGMLQDGDPDPYLSYFYSAREIAEGIAAHTDYDKISRLFELHPINCEAYYGADGRKIDTLIVKFRESGSRDVEAIEEIINIIRAYPKKNRDYLPLIEAVRKYLDANFKNEADASTVAENIGVSVYYMTHLFNERSGTTVVDYRNEKRLTHAKTALINTDKSISIISEESGFFDADSFTKAFVRSESITPIEYRKYHKK